MKPERLSGLEVLLATVMLAGVFIAGDVAVIDVNPVLVAALRFVAAAVVLVGVLTALRLGGRIDARGWGLILACGLSGVFLYNAFFFYGLKLSNVSHGAAIIATIPILVALIESAWNRSLPARHQMVGAALAFLGVLVIVEYSAFFGDLSTVTASTPAGDLAFLLAALCFAVYSIIGRRATARFGAYRATTYNITAGAAMLAVGSFAFTDPVAALTSSQMSIQFAALIAYMALFGTVLAFVFYYRGVQSIGPQRTSMFLNMVPVWVVVLAAVLLGQPITTPVAVGIPTVILGLLVFQQNPLALLHRRAHRQGSR
jgi:drug/metabolite transporter (DMT)-like permease